MEEQAQGRQSCPHKGAAGLQMQGLRDEKDQNSHKGRVQFASHHV